MNNPSAEATNWSRAGSQKGYSVFSAMIVRGCAAPAWSAGTKGGRGAKPSSHLISLMTLRFSLFKEKSSLLNSLALYLRFKLTCKWGVALSWIEGR